MKELISNLEVLNRKAEKWEVCDCNIPDSRHGAMVRLSEEEYNHVLSSFSQK